ncbi:hypothetical protein [Streptomyces albireticuli]|uniref:Uncharacterized protein n=1 Tax=Streptomyces albireticuli TaxID=1940 RepID=A0A2A2D4V1_9ACTN|nr:hypothetical protein [Streptomyces albireticuli]MCD9144357.1 hypothetical protein [Streptomyces albireticuli]MCD9162000.1 hypothetical protein [Streptomyces albireticuli]MCD9193994.1 hypothetical protein [Streptomyces albireticuli]PAU47518.1 hypothetical protein CK936_18150 [Streptomyces albireticuli]
MPPALLAITLLLGVTLCYIAVCAVSPFGSCRKCRGFGYAMTTDRKGRPKRGKHCRRCDGHGKRIRVGRHVYNAAARVHRDGTR